MAIPDKIDYLIIGAGIHGLSTALHLAKKLKAQGKGDGSNIIVIDKEWDIDSMQMAIWRSFNPILTNEK